MREVGTRVSTSVRAGVAAVFWRFSRWEYRSDPQPETTRILLGAPHTSNWDFIYMLAITWRLRIRVKWLGKQQLFAGWRGPIMRALGGIPVDRANPASVVSEILQAQREAPFSLVVTPDGTRKGATHWKSGFYRIARAADLPVGLGYIDRPTRTTGIGPTITLTGDVAADMERIRAFYADKAGYTPENRIEPRLRDESPDVGEQEGPTAAGEGPAGEGG
nr:1-acyl-sn-glycerol-3-phosphate acyltransferase [Serinibacter salmoneus]